MSSAARRSDWTTIPNLLSLGRLAATPLFCWLILADHRLAATVLLGVMGITDNLDGRIARATDSVTELGTILDPAADRIVVMAAIVTLMVSGGLPVWLGVPVLLRDAAISVVFLSLARRGYGKPKVKRVGKAATFALLTALPGLVYGGVLEVPGLVLFTLGGVLYFVAAYRYAQDIGEWLKEQRAPLV